MIVSCTLAKEIDGSITYLYPKSTCDLIEYDNSQNSATKPTMSAQDKFDELSSNLSNLQDDTTSKFKEYYTSLAIDDILYTPVTIDLFTSSVVNAEIGTSGPTTLTWKVTRMTPITQISVNGTTIQNPDTVASLGKYTYSGTNNVTYVSTGAAITSQQFTMSVTDTKTTSHAATTATKSVSVNFYYPVFYGMLDSATITAAQIANLIRDRKNDNKGTGTYEFGAAASNGYMWFCCPSDYTVKFSVGGFEGGFNAPVAVSGVVVNSNITRAYNCYRSTNRMTANTTVTVS